MKRFLLTSIFIIAVAGCRTVEIPLSGVMVGRPHTLGSQVGIRSTFGVVQAPKVQGVVDEVVDSEGKVINPLASESAGDSRATLPMVEFGIGFAKHVEVGVSTNRGFNGMIDLYRGNIWTASIAGSAMTNSVSIKKEDKGKTAADKDEDKNKTFNSVDDLSGRASNQNLTLLTSARFGDQVWAQFSLYGGVGINQYSVEISDLDTHDTKKKTQIAPSALMGVQGKIAIFEMSGEIAGIKIHERNHKEKFVPLCLFTATVRFDYFGSSPGGK